MREFRFLEEKRKAGGLSPAEEQRWLELRHALGAPEPATPHVAPADYAQPLGYYAADGNWYPYQAAEDPSAYAQPGSGYAEAGYGYEQAAYPADAMPLAGEGWPSAEQAPQAVPYEGAEGYGQQVPVASGEAWGVPQDAVAQEAAAWGTYQSQPAWDAQSLPWGAEQVAQQDGQPQWAPEALAPPAPEYPAQPEGAHGYVPLSQGYVPTSYAPEGYVPIAQGYAPFSQPEATYGEPLPADGFPTEAPADAPYAGGWAQQALSQDAEPWAEPAQPSAEGFAALDPGGPQVPESDTGEVMEVDGDAITMVEAEAAEASEPLTTLSEIPAGELEAASPAALEPQSPEPAAWGAATPLAPDVSTPWVQEEPAATAAAGLSGDDAELPSIDLSADDIASAEEPPPEAEDLEATLPGVETPRVADSPTRVVELSDLAAATAFESEPTQSFEVGLRADEPTLIGPAPTEASPGGRSEVTQPHIALPPEPTAEVPAYGSFGDLDEADSPTRPYPAAMFDSPPPPPEPISEENPVGEPSPSVEVNLDTDPLSVDVDLQTLPPSGPSAQELPESVEVNLASAPPAPPRASSREPDFSGHAEDAVPLAQNAEFVQFQREEPPQGFIELSMDDAPSGPDLVESGPLASMANPSWGRGEAPAGVEPEPVPLATAADFLDEAATRTGAEAWGESSGAAATAVDIPVDAWGAPPTEPLAPPEPVALGDHQAMTAVDIRVDSFGADGPAPAAEWSPETSAAASLDASSLEQTAEGGPAVAPAAWAGESIPLGASADAQGLGEAAEPTAAWEPLGSTADVEARLDAAAPAWEPLGSSADAEAPLEAAAPAAAWDGEPIPLGSPADAEAPLEAAAPAAAWEPLGSPADAQAPLEAAAPAAAWDAEAIPLGSFADAEVPLEAAAPAAAWDAEASPLGTPADADAPIEAAPAAAWEPLDSPAAADAPWSAVRPGPSSDEAPAEAAPTPSPWTAAAADTLALDSVESGSTAVAAAASGAAPLAEAVIPQGDWSATAEPHLDIDFSAPEPLPAPVPPPPSAASSAPAPAEPEEISLVEDVGPPPAAVRPPLATAPRVPFARIALAKAAVPVAPAAPLPPKAATPRREDFFDRSGLQFDSLPSPGASAAAPAAEPVAAFVEGEHRVIVHTVEGQVKRGTVRDLDLGEDVLALEQSGAAAEQIPVQRVKAIFFMLPPGARPLDTTGDKVRVTFNDGRQVAGFSTDHKSKERGFFVVPADNRTNTARIYIYRASVQALSVG